MVLVVAVVVVVAVAVVVVVMVLILVAVVVVEVLRGVQPVDERVVLGTHPQLYVLVELLHQH